jgi:hypothetical protein
MNTQKINLAKLSANFSSWKNCVKNNNKMWEDTWKDSIDKQLELLPHGSGLDAGVHFDWKTSTPDKLIFKFSFHHMEDGYYDGWTDHQLILTPAFHTEYNIKITGEDRNDIKDYLYELFDHIFTLDHHYRTKPSTPIQTTIPQPTIFHKWRTIIHQYLILLKPKTIANQIITNPNNHNNQRSPLS